ncbi:MAG TPA: AI-2E family transporter [Acidiferrobacterales bacterium]|nr:AI-2E family transporter [Acidiferrobacterales bacterium]
MDAAQRVVLTCSLANDLKMKRTFRSERKPSRTGKPANPGPDPLKRTPINVRSFSLVMLTVLAVIFTLNWAKAVFIPLMLGVMISYALSPLVALIQKWHVPRAIGAGVLLLGIVGGAGYLVYSLSDDAAELIETLPEAAQKFRKTLRAERGTSEGTMEKVQKAATQIERAASETGAPAPVAPSGVTRVQIEKPKINVKDYLLIGTLGVFGAAAQTGIVLFLAYFLLVSGDTFRRKLIKITGPTLSEKKITLQVLDDINGQIQRYLLVLVFTSILVGIVSWLAFLWIGLEHAAIWGIAAGVFNTIPYLGPVVVGGGTSLVALFQFGTINMALLVGGISLAITSLEGYLLTPWLTGRASRMSAVVVFVSVLFWGWLWGVWGLLLGVPIMMVIKAVCDRVDELKPIGELLGE